MSGSAAVLGSPWLVLLLAAAWLFTVVAVATVMYGIAKLVIDKTDPQDLPDVLVALAPLLHSTARLVRRVPDQPVLGGFSTPAPDEGEKHGEGGQIS